MGTELFESLEELGDDGVQLTDNKTFIDQTVSLASWIAMPKYAEENHDVLVRFARALYKGFDYRADHSHDDEVCGWIADKIKLEKNALLDQVEVADWTTSEFIRIIWMMSKAIMNCSRNHLLRAVTVKKHQLIIMFFSM